jgi:hypothetical protein
MAVKGERHKVARDFVTATRVTEGVLRRGLVLHTDLTPRPPSPAPLRSGDHDLTGTLSAVLRGQAGVPIGAGAGSVMS